MRAHLSSAALCVLLACDGNGFNDDELLHRPGRLHGVAYVVDSGGVHAASGARVFVIDDDGARQTTTTGADGAFVVASVPAGPARVIVNQGGTLGSLRQLNVYGDGDNDLGELYLLPIEQVAALLDIPDIGFEERVTRAAGNAESGLARPDGTAVYFLRPSDDRGSYELHELQLPSGEDRVLWTPWGTPSAAAWLDDHSFSFGTCAYDLDHHMGCCTPGAWQAAWNGVLYSYQDDNAYASLSTCPSHGERFLGMHAVFARALESYAAGAVTLMFDQTDGTATLTHWNLDSPSASPPATIAHNIHPYAALVADGHDRAYYLADFDLGAVDFAAGTSRVLYHDIMYSIWPAGPSRVIVSGYLGLFSRSPNTSLWLMKTDRPPLVTQADWDATFTMLPAEPRMTINGHDVTLCEDRVEGDCSAQYLPTGVIRIATAYGPERYVVDTDDTGKVLRKRVLDLNDPGTTLIARPDGGQEAIARRDSPNGFLQLYVGDLDRDEPQYRQVTFLRADHSTPFYSADGDWLYSFAREPLSGYVQLVRVRVRQRE
jgi:hypothetical protein